MEQPESLAAIGHGQERATVTLETILAAAQPRAVFGEPVRSGDDTVITASEISAGGGSGPGQGRGERAEGAAPAEHGGWAALAAAPPWAAPSR